MKEEAYILEETEWDWVLKRWVIGDLHSHRPPLGLLWDKREDQDWYFALDHLRPSWATLKRRVKAVRSQPLHTNPAFYFWNIRVDEEEEEDGHGTIPGPDFHGEFLGESQLHTPLGPSFCSLVRALRGVNRGLIFSSVFRKHLFKSVFNWSCWTVWAESTCSNTYFKNMIHILLEMYFNIINLQVFWEKIISGILCFFPQNVCRCNGTWG